jgi:hypothetical protein
LEQGGERCKTKRSTKSNKIVDKEEIIQMVEERDPWELESGLPNDIDAYMWNCRFGIKDKYVQAVTVGGGEEEGVAGLMFIADFYNEKGESLGTDQVVSQGFSVGSGWIPSEDGKSIHHPSRMNVVDNTRYGQLQKRVIKELGVNMKQYGVPINASVWDGMGFHWMMEEHATIKGKEPKRGLMPTIFLGRKLAKDAPVQATGAASAAGVVKVEAPAEVLAKLKNLASVVPDIQTFQRLALKEPGVVGNDELMGHVLDVSPAGYFAQNRSK